MTGSTVMVVDYGMGNLRSVGNALTALGVEHIVATEPSQVAEHEKVILPGVGAFEEAVAHLAESGMADALRQHVEDGKLLLGICLGMQLICSRSFEGGIHDGFGWIPAQVKRFPSTGGIKVPHIGWNAIDLERESPLVAGIESGSDVYFVHSYYVDCERPGDVLASTEHGLRFASMIQHGNVFGMQFHPEKSQQTGLRLLSNFVHMETSAASMRVDVHG